MALGVAVAEEKAPSAPVGVPVALMEGALEARLLGLGERVTVPLPDSLPVLLGVADCVPLPEGVPVLLRESEPVFDALAPAVSVVVALALSVGLGVNEALDEAVLQGVGVLVVVPLGEQLGVLLSV